MNIAMKLTVDGLVRALRWKAFAEEESAALRNDRRGAAESSTGMEISSGDTDDAWRGSIAEGAV